MASLELMEMVRRHEGVRDQLYQDCLGFWTIGVGHLVDVRKGDWCDDNTAARLSENGFRLSPAVIDAYLRDDLVAAERDVETLMAASQETLNDARYAALVSMAFNLGASGFASFTKARAAINRGQWREAHDQLLDSKLARQLPQRAKEIAEIILHGG